MWGIKFFEGLMQRLPLILVIFRYNYVNIILSLSCSSIGLSTEVHMNNFQVDPVEDKV